MDFEFDQTDRDEAERTRPHFLRSENAEGDAVAIVRLSREYKAHDKDIGEITIVEPDARQMEIFGRSQNQVEGTHRLMAACAKIPYASIAKFKARDMKCCYEALASVGFQPEEE